MAIVIVFGVLLLALMLFGWRARRRRQAGVAAPHAAPAELGRLLGTFDGKYVATTTAGDPLDRIAVHNLGFRGAASVTVTEAGLLVQRPGADDAWIPKAELRGWRRATWTIDRVVEPDGLELVEWMLGSRRVDTYLRLDDPAGFDAALTPLLPTERQAS